MNVTLRVSTPVYPTEVEEKVRTAVTNIFPIEPYQGLYGEGNLESLRKLHLLLREERILDTARSIFLAGMEGNAIKFHLNKQAAFVRKVNFSTGNESLGSIDVEISAENKKDLFKIIDWLAPQTVEGKPVEEIEL